MAREHRFDEEYFLRIQKIRGHWWVLGMQRIGAALLGATPPGRRVLDAGCGAGATLPWAHRLAAPLPAYGVDVAPAAVDECRRLGLGTALAVASTAALPFPDGSLDLVVSLDVLQHLPSGDDARAARELGRVLVPGGRALVRTNCAHGRGHVAEHDHWRMYRPESLRALLEDAGLEVQVLTPVNLVQGLWSTITRPLGRRGPAPGEHDDLAAEHRATHGVGIPDPVHPLKNRLLLQLLRLEARYLSRPGRSLPFGHSLYAVAGPRDRQGASRSTRSPVRADR